MSIEILKSEEPIKFENRVQKENKQLEESIQNNNLEQNTFIPFTKNGELNYTYSTKMANGMTKE